MTRLQFTGLGTPETTSPLGDFTRQRERRDEVRGRVGGGGWLFDQGVVSNWFTTPLAHDISRHIHGSNDPDFQLTADKIERWGTGIRPELWENFGSARSDADMAIIAGQSLQIQTAREQLEVAGVQGTLANIGAAMLDPAFLAGGAAAGLLTGGTGAIAAASTRTARVAMLARSGRLAGDVGARVKNLARIKAVDQGFRAGAKTRILAPGIGGAISDTAMQAYIVSQDPEADSMTVLYTAMASMALGTVGGGVGEVFRSKYARAARNVQRAIELDDTEKVIAHAMGAASPLGMFREGELTPAARREVHNLIGRNRDGSAYFRQQISKAEQKATVQRIVADAGFDPDSDIARELAEMEPLEALDAISKAQSAFYDREAAAAAAGDDLAAANAARRKMDPDAENAKVKVGDGEPDPPRLGDADFSWFRKIREVPLRTRLAMPGTYNAYLGRFKDPVVRAVAYLYAPDFIGREGGVVQGATAIEAAGRANSRFRLKAINGAGGYRDGLRAYRESIPSAADSPEGRLAWLLKSEASFRREVSKAVREGGHIDPNIAGTADVYRKVFGEVLEFAQRHSLRGLDEVQPDPNYFPLIFSPQKVAAVLRSPDGEAAALRLVAEAIDIDDEKIQALLGPVIRLAMKEEDITNAELAKLLGADGAELASNLQKNFPNKLRSQARADELDQLGYRELQAQAKAAGIPATGKKADLVERLVAHEASGQDDLQRLSAILNRSTDEMLEIGRKLAKDRIARGYIKTISKLDSINHGMAARAFSGEDMEGLAQLLARADVDEDTIRVVQSMAEKARGDAGAATPFAMKSMPMNRAHHVEWAGGADGMLRFGDLAEEDVITVADRYISDMVGNSVAQRTYDEVAQMMGREAGAFQTFDAMAQALRTHMAKIPEIATDRNANRIADKAISQLRDLDQHIKGHSVVTTDTGRDTLRRLRLVTSGLYSGTFGLINATEFGQVLSQAGVRNTFRAAPAIKGVLKRARAGKMTDEDLDMIDAWVGAGFDRDIQQWGSKFADGGHMDEAGQLGTDRALWQLARTANDANLMSFIDRRLKITFAGAAEQKWIRFAESGKLPSQRRLESWGLDADMTRRILAEIKSSGGTVMQSSPTGRQVKRLAISKWKDRQAANAFLTAMDRWSGSAVQRNAISDLHPWLARSELAKTFFQFRLFPLVSTDKQLFSRMHLRDGMAAWSAVAGYGSAVMLHVARTHMDAMGVPAGADRREFLEQNLSNKAIFIGSQRYAGFASFAPEIFDEFAGKVDSDYQLFNNRVSGLSSGILSFSGNNPGAATATAVADIAMGGVRALRDGKIDRKTAKAAGKLIPGRRVPIFKQLVDQGIELFPEEE